VGREYKLLGTEFGLVIFDRVVEQNTARNSGVDTVLVCKGGVHGSQNALNARWGQRDSFGDLLKKDIPRLGSARTHGAAAWLVCIDIAGVGTQLVPSERKALGDECKQCDVGLIYFIQTKKDFEIRSFGDNAARILPLRLPPTSSDGGRPLNLLMQPGSDFLREFSREAATVPFKEASMVALLYHYLRKAGYNHLQLSLETYFTFAPEEGKAMARRPDISVFTPKVQGHFNLYRHGDPGRSNDVIKLESLLGLLEVKSTTESPLTRRGRIAELCFGDIKKLCHWRERIERAYRDLGISAEEQSPIFVFILTDRFGAVREHGELPRLENRAGQAGVGFVYAAPASLSPSPGVKTSAEQGTNPR